MLNVFTLFSKRRVWVGLRCLLLQAVKQKSCPSRVAGQGAEGGQGGLCTVAEGQAPAV